ncbi:hypothetical protein L798_14275 [Zootermopsis nevadensis]|uniref:Uncharacterized protein n=2 Tax=Zootermopsis nevadensis TaxID=136037 RepID=A0A067RUM3_ZOONE|nr:hypothetical protein L798_14275 [Zootermopsis nevadensis]
MVSNSITTSPAGKYVHQYTAPYRESPSYGVQTGYEGYLIPAPLADTTGSEEEGGFLNFLTDLGEQIGELGGQGGSGGHEPHSVFPYRQFLLLPLLHKLILPLKLLAKLGLWLFAPLSLVLLGGALTVGVCVFTPVCTLSFLGFGFTRDTVRTFINEDRLASISTFVTSAINKFQLMQKKPHKKEMLLSAQRTMKSDPQQQTSKDEVQIETKRRRK